MPSLDVYVQEASTLQCHAGHLTPPESLALPMNVTLVCANAATADAIATLGWEPQKGI